jgi:deazaflavin-dependent oxidoreductase (nitroreductase family)
VPLPLALGRFNSRYTNRLIGPILVWLPGFGRVVHVGRRTGRVRRTPMTMFRHGDRAVFALTYGSRTEWLRNVLAAGTCGWESPRSTPLRLTDPELVHDPSRRLAPWIMRLPLAVIRVQDFLVMRVAPEGGTARIGTRVLLAP